MERGRMLDKALFQFCRPVVHLTEIFKYVFQDFTLEVLKRQLFQTRRRCLAPSPPGLPVR